MVHSNQLLNGKNSWKIGLNKNYFKYKVTTALDV